jgi:hypothetical protein
LVATWSLSLRPTRAFASQEVAEEFETPPFFERAMRRVELARYPALLEQLRPRLREIAEQRLAAHGLRLRTEEAGAARR